jgi:hypothetical protein
MGVPGYDNGKPSNIKDGPQGSGANKGRAEAVGVACTWAGGDYRVRQRRQRQFSKATGADPPSLPLTGVTSGIVHGQATVPRWGHIVDGCAGGLGHGHSCAGWATG